MGCSSSSPTISKTGHVVLLNMVVWDENQRILVAQSGMLPHVIIEQNYQGKSDLTQTNTDFLRMFKTSFNWSSMETYMEHLKYLKKEHKLNSYSIDIYKKFMNAIQDLSTVTNIPLHQFGHLYWQPFNEHFITLVFKSTAAKIQEYTQHAKQSFHFSYPQAVQLQLNRFLFSSVDDDDDERAKGRKDPKHKPTPKKHQRTYGKKAAVKKDGIAIFQKMNSFYSTSSQSASSPVHRQSSARQLNKQQGANATNNCILWLKELEGYLERYTMPINQPNPIYLDHVKKNRIKKRRNGAEEEEATDQESGDRGAPDEEDIVANNAVSNLPASTVQNSSSSSVHDRYVAPANGPTTVALNNFNPQNGIQNGAQLPGVYSASFQAMPFPTQSNHPVVKITTSPNESISAFLQELGRRDLKVPAAEIETTVTDWVRIINNSTLAYYTNLLLKQNQSDDESPTHESLSAQPDHPTNKSSPKAVQTKAQLQELVLKRAEMWNACTLPVHVKTCITNYFNYLTGVPSPSRHSITGSPQPNFLQTPPIRPHSIHSAHDDITNMPALPPPMAVPGTPLIDSYHLQHNTVNNLHVGLYFAQTSADKASSHGKLHRLCMHSNQYAQCSIVSMCVCVHCILLYLLAVSSLCMF